jgi:hypothetical protein
MSTRNTVPAFILSAAALATLCLLAAVITAQKGPNTTLVTKAAQLSLTNTTLATMTVPVPGAPLKGVDVKLGRNPGGSPQSRTTDENGKIDLSDLAPGSYWMEIAPLSNAQKAANAGGEDYSYLVVTITGTRLVGKTKTRSLDVNKWKFVEPPIATARRTPLPNTFAARIVFEVGPSTGGGHPPVPVGIEIVRAKSNITNN